MFEFMWESMSISYMGFLGMIFWSIGITVFGFVVAVFAFAVSGEWKTKREWETKREKKYKGQPIVIKGGKEDE